MYDAVGQFYPWRVFAARTYRSGTVPLWNPYQFCGTPFAANSQSAILYPPNVLYYILPVPLAFGIGALMHLLLAASFTYLFMRALGSSRTAATLGGIVYAFSTWQLSWLELPTFLCTSCWLPLVLTLTLRTFEAPSWRRAAGLGAAIGLTLLAGHLQIAFYVLMTAALFALWLGLSGRNAATRQSNARPPVPLLLLGSLALGIALAAPQILPAVELSGRSHRVAAPGSAGYAAYTGYAVPPHYLAALFVPDFFNNPSDPNAPYVGTSRSGMLFNYAEGALYVGLLPLVLAVIAVLPGGREGRIGLNHEDTEPQRERGGELRDAASPHPPPPSPKNGRGGVSPSGRGPVPPLGGQGVPAPTTVQSSDPTTQTPNTEYRTPTVFFAALAILALLMALGTPIDALLYFGVPGFGQSGSPGRVLVVWAFSLAALAAFGLDRLLAFRLSTLRRVVAAVFIVGAAALLACAAGSGAVGAMQLAPEAWHPKVAQQAALFALAAAYVVTAATGRLRRAWRVAAPVGLVAADLFATGGAYNLTASPDELYPLTPGIQRLRQIAGHDRIMPVNRGWSFEGPRAVLPPNGAMVFGLRDVQGYDSLFPGQYKALMNRLAGGRDASPEEVGNMVFAKDPTSPLVPQLGVRAIVTRLDAAPGEAPRPDAMQVSPLVGTAGRAAASTQDGRPARVEWLDDGATRIRLRVDAPAAASLTLADEAYPGWTATVDGSAAPIERVNTIFRRVAVPAGMHVIEFRYAPSAFRVGLYAMVLAIGCLVLGIGYSTGKRGALGRAL